MATKNGEYGGWRRLVIHSLISALISTSLVGGFLTWQFNKNLESWRSKRAWQAAALSEVMAPIVIHFERTSVIGNRYRHNPRYGEAVLLRESNNAVRELLLSKAQFLPNELLAPSGCLLAHYDIWLNRFDTALREYKDTHGSDPPLDAEFDVGSSEIEDPNCGKFPQQVPPLFRAQRDKLMKEVYGFAPKPDSQASQGTPASGRP